VSFDCHFAYSPLSKSSCVEGFQNGLKNAKIDIKENWRKILLISGIFIGGFVIFLAAENKKLTSRVYEPVVVDGSYDPNMEYVAQTGSTVYYKLVLEPGQMALDGFSREVIMVNGKIPGPTLSLTLGQTMEVTVVNMLDDPSSIHWHGIFQQGTPYYDGAAGVTQCEIPAAGGSLVYRFTPTEAGTFWYHSHSGVQYANGFFGALIVHAKNETYYDDERVLVLSDWYHSEVEELLVNFLSASSGGNEPVPDSALINGVGRFNCSYSAHTDCTQLSVLEGSYKIRLVAGKTYRLRLINAAGFSSFFFAIDGHNMTLIEIDGIEYTPTQLQMLELSVAQRISVLIKPTKVGSFWIRARLDQNIYTYVNPSLDLDAYAIMSVTETATTSYSVSKWIPSTSMAPGVFPVGANRSMFYNQELSLKPAQAITVPAVNTRVEFNFDIYDNGYGVVLPFVGGVNTLIPSTGSYTPMLYQLNADNTTTFSADYSSVTLSGGGEIVEVVIINNDMGDHPIHLHGHNFWVLARGEGNATAAYAAALNTDSPLKRDVIRVPAAGYAIIRFIADNPGVWLLHCHMEWHFAAGLAMTFIEDTASIGKLQIPSEFTSLCSASS
jgi:FtsP/CotA-like multicopper oxidase with cupredoxin domain